MKKRTAIFFVLCLMLFISALPSQALQWDNGTRGVITPMFTYISLFETSFDITSSGRADVAVLIYAPSAHDTGVRADLQQYKNGSWTTIKTWSAAEEGSSCGLGKSWYVASGYSYRVVSYGYVYINNVIVESTSITTKSHSY